jgi:hypothetical protein
MSKKQLNNSIKISSATPKITELLIEGWDYIDSNDYSRLLDEMGISYKNNNIEKKVEELYEKYKYLDEEVVDFDLDKGIVWRIYYFQYENNIYGVEMSFDNNWAHYEITRKPFKVESYQQTITKYKVKNTNNKIVWVVMSDYKGDPTVCSIHASEEGAKSEKDIINNRFCSLGLSKHAYIKKSVLILDEDRIFDVDWIIKKN